MRRGVSMLPQSGMRLQACGKVMVKPGLGHLCQLLCGLHRLAGLAGLVGLSPLRTYTAQCEGKPNTHQSDKLGERPSKMLQQPILVVPHRPHYLSLRRHSDNAKAADLTAQSDLPPISTDELFSPSHIRGLAKKLKCGTAEMRSLVRDHTFLLHMDLDLVERKINLLLSYDLPLSFVKEHLRVMYQTSAQVLEERLKLIKESGLLHSPHLEIERLANLLECNSVQFPKSFKYRYDQREALEGCTDQMSYLQMRLSCSQSTAEDMLNTFPLMRHVSNVKLKALLDFFLIELDKNPDFVITHRKLFTFSVSRLHGRWLVMQKAGVVSDSQMVQVWCMPQKVFEKHYKTSSSTAPSQAAS